MFTSQPATAYISSNYYSEKLISDLNSNPSHGKQVVQNTDAEDKKLKKTCADFEAMLLNIMMKSMRKALPGGGIFEKSLQKDIFESMYDQHLSEEISRGNNSLGIKEILFRQLQRPDNGNRDNLKQCNQVTDNS